MSNVRVVAAVVDTKQLTLYKDDGNTVAIPQGDPRLRKILDEITPVISNGGVANVNVAEVNVYRDFEEQTGGFARFFRVAKNKVASFFGASNDDEKEMVNNPVPSVQLGTIPALSTAIDDIIAHAKPAANDDGAVNTNETVVAVVGSGAEARVIPGMENLKDQFIHALKLGSTKGVEAFLKRISAVIDQRQHSVHDLLRFMERGDLPIADDGSIIIYKILRHSKDREAFVDCHSGKVIQKVGSYVCMDPSMVDHNRRNECSNGLHVARRGYLSNFYGDVCVLAKVAPEDVIAVPNYDANKMRVCGYHIIFELDEQSFSKLKNNQPMTDNPKAQALLGRAISGDHIGKVEEVRITEQRGGGVKVTPLRYQTSKERARGEPVRKATALDDVASVPSVDPKAVAKQVTEAKAQPKPPINSNSRQQTARALFDEGDIQGLIGYKRATKVSWASLSMSEEEQKHILEMASVPKPAPKPATKPTPTVKAPAKKAAPTPQRGRPVHGKSIKARLFDLDKIYSDPKADPRHRALAAVELLSLRPITKKSWSALGYPKLTDQILRDDAKRFQTQADKAARAAQPAPTTGTTNQDVARQYFNAKDWKGLVSFQRRKKKGWAALGFTSQEQAEIKLHIGG